MRIGSEKITSDTTFFIAEAGANHNGDLDLACKLVDIAARAGADAVKFQTFRPADLVYEKSDGIDDLRRLALDRGEFEELFQYAVDQGITFLSTPFERQSATFLCELGVEAIKVGSGEINNYPLLEHIAGLGRPMIVSTGMATKDEIREAERRIRTVSPDLDVVFLHCVSAYPTNVGDANLRMMDDIDRLVDGPVGFSDHTMEVATPALAAGMGANVVEKHFTISRRLPGPDHEMSLEPDELDRAVTLVRQADVARGSNKKRPLDVETDNLESFRKSVHAVEDIKAGEEIGRGDVAILRPATGLSPDSYDDVVASIAKKSIPAGRAITESDLEKGGGGGMGNDVA